jgi:hypothetical protein
MLASCAIVRVMQEFPCLRLAPGEALEEPGAERQHLALTLSNAEGCKVLLDSEMGGQEAQKRSFQSMQAKGSVSDSCSRLEEHHDRLRYWARFRCPKQEARSCYIQVQSTLWFPSNQ